ncbi:hypothetical protein ACLOJK_032364 [Asimina triloba]
MEVLWPDIPEIPAVDPVFRPRVFAPYESRSGGFSREEGNFQPNRRNSTRRMIELLRAMWSASVDRRERDCSQGYRHMIKERRRREEMRQRYLDLRSMLPPGTKSDNITVIQEAASHLINLQCLKEELQRRNQELEASLQKIKEPFPEGAANVEFEVVDPPSAVGLMIEVMKCLKSREMKVRAIRSTPTTGGMKVTVETVNETSASCSALTEVAKELAFDFVEASNAGAAEKYFSSGDDTWHGDIGSRHF